MRRILPAIPAMLATLVLAGEAAAQRDTEVVVGSGSYNEAPVLEPGSYADTIRGTETNVYAVELQPGQQLEAQVTVDKQNFDGIEGIVGLVAQIATPARVPAGEAEDDVSFAASPGGKVAIQLTGPEAQDSTTAAGDDIFPAPGRWYIEAAIDDPNEEVGKIEFPLELEIQVNGTPTAEEEPPIEPEPEPEPEIEEPGTVEEEPSDSDSDESMDGTTVALIGLGGVLLGGLAGAARGHSRKNQS